MEDRYMHKNIRIGVGAAALALVLTGCAANMPAPKEKVLTVNGESMSVGTASVALRYQQAALYSYYSYFLGSDFMNQELSEGKTYGDSIRESVLSDLGDLLLLQEHMGEFNVALTDEEKSEAAKAAEEFIASNDEETLTAMLATEEDVQNFLELQAIKTHMMAEIRNTADQEVSDEEAGQTTINFVLVSTAAVTDEEGNTNDLTEEEIAEKKALAEEILEKAAAGAEFADVVSEAGEDLRVSSYSFTTAASEEFTMDPAVQTAIDGLEDGAYAAEPVETDLGYYVVKMVNNFDEARTESKKASIIEERKSECYNEQLDTWRKDAKIEVVDKVWKKLTMFDTYTVYYEPETEALNDALESEMETEGLGVNMKAIADVLEETEAEFETEPETEFETEIETEA